MTATHTAVRASELTPPAAPNEVSPAPAAQIKVRLYEDRDREGLFAVYLEAFGAEALERFQRRWQWQFIDNPAAAHAPMMVWVGELDGQVVGCLSSHLVRMKIGDRQIPHRYCNDLAVSSSARGWGLGTRLIGAYFAVVQQLATAMYFNPANRKIHDRHGYMPVRIYPMLVRPLNLSAMVRFETSSGRLPAVLQRAPISWIVRGGAWTVGLVVSALNRFLLPMRSPAYRIERAHEAGEEFDVLWRSLRDQFPITTVRDRAFVQWRFFDDPAFTHTVLVARDQARTARGYLAISVSDNRGMRVGRILDVFTPPSDPRMLDALLREALERFRTARVDVVACLGTDPRLRERLRRCLYLAPKSRQSLVLVAWRGREEDRALVMEENNYHLSGADGDQWFAP
ncbi:MAG: GNAT family N-acetyltransferase [Gemmatimonadaceae bacterium]